MHYATEMPEICGTHENMKVHEKHNPTYDYNRVAGTRAPSAFEVIPWGERYRITQFFRTCQKE